MHFQGGITKRKLRKLVCNSSPVTGIRCWSEQLSLVWWRKKSAWLYSTGGKRDPPEDTPEVDFREWHFVPGTCLVGWWFALALCQPLRRYMFGLRVDACTWLWNALGWNRVGLRSQGLAPYSVTPPAGSLLSPWQAWQHDHIFHYISL